MTFKSIAEKESLTKELQDKGYAHRSLPGLIQPQYGFYQKPNGEIVRLPIGEDRLQFYNAKGFKYIAPEGVTTLEELLKKQREEVVKPVEDEKPKSKPRRKIKHRKTKERRKTQ
jgi:hypothetical protein